MQIATGGVEYTDSAHDKSREMLGIRETFDSPLQTFRHLPLRNIPGVNILRRFIEPMNNASRILFLLLIPAFVVAQDANTSSSMFHSGPERVGIYQTKAYANFGSPKWMLKTAGKVFSSPVVFDGSVFIGSEDGHLYAIDATSGKIKWKFKTGAAVHSSPAVHGTMVYFGSFDGYYYALDRKSGKEVWRFKTGGEQLFGAKGYWNLKPEEQYHADPWQYFMSSPVVGNIDNKVTVYFGSSDANVYAVDGASGVLKWSYRTNGPVHSSPALRNGRIYIGSWDAAVYALDAFTGKLAWKFQTGQQTGMTGVQASPAVDNNTVYIGARDAKFYALDAMSGKKKWEYNADNSWVLSTAAVKDNTVYFGTSDSFRFVALDASTGKEKFHMKVNGYLYASPAIAGNTAYFGDFTGKMYAVNLTSKGKQKDEYILKSRTVSASRVLAGDTLNFQHASSGKDVGYYAELKSAAETFYQLGSIVSSACVHDGVIYFGSADGNVYAIGLSTTD